MAGEVNPIIKELRSTAAKDAGGYIDQRMVNKAVLKFRDDLVRDPSAEKPETQAKIRQGLELKGLSEAEKIAVAKAALQTIEGGGKPAVASNFNTQASGTNKPERDHVAELRAKQAEIAGTHVNDAERRAEALKAARTFIAGKETEVKDIISKQTPEVQAQAQKIMGRIDSMDNARLEGLVHDVASQSKQDISKLSASDISLVKTTAKALVAENLARATTPAQIQKVLDNIDMGAIFHKAADKSLQRLEDLFNKTPTTDQVLQQAAKGVGMQADAMELSLKAQEAERQRVRDMRENDPAAYKAFCADTKNSYNPVIAGECTPALKR